MNEILNSYDFNYLDWWTKYFASTNEKNPHEIDEEIESEEDLKIEKNFFKRKGIVAPKLFLPFYLICII